MLHRVGILWIIETHEQLKFDIDKHNSEWITSFSWYKTYICKNLYGKVCEVFIKIARTDRYNIMCYIDYHEKLHQSSCDDNISGVVVHCHQIQQ